MIPAVAAYELQALSARLLELEHERAEATDQARLLFALQEPFRRLAATRAADAVIHEMLRTAREPLGFSRGIYFCAKREHGIEARWGFDGDGAVEPSREIADLGPRGAILRALRGDVPQSVGTAAELDAPLVDTRGWYVVTALTHANGALGVLYVDGHRSGIPREWEAGMLWALATLTSVSLQNSLQFERTEHLATHDPLTGLLNRRAFAAKLEAAITSARMTGHHLTYVMVDVDDFKQVNDAHGHGRGDAILIDVGRTLARSSRAEDTVGRYAGDEFVVLIENLEPDLARSLVGRLSMDLRTRGLRCSLGAAHYPRDARDANGLFIAADRALYATKAAGKNGYSFA